MKSQRKGFSLKELVIFLAILIPLILYLNNRDNQRRHIKKVRTNYLVTLAQLNHLNKMNATKKLGDTADLHDLYSKSRFMKHESNGYLIYYSVGPDLKDDGCMIQYDPTNGVISSGDIYDFKHKAAIQGPK